MFAGAVAAFGLLDLCPGCMNTHVNVQIVTKKLLSFFSSNSYFIKFHSRYNQMDLLESAIPYNLRHPTEATSDWGSGCCLTGPLTW